MIVGYQHTSLSFSNDDQNCHKYDLANLVGDSVNIVFSAYYLVSSDMFIASGRRAPEHP